MTVSQSAHLAGGIAVTSRDLAGFIGLALLATAAAGDGLTWIGPIAYLGLALAAVIAHWMTPWAWPVRPAARPRRTGAAA